MAFSLEPQSLDWALAHIGRHGDTAVFPRPFEFAAISEDWQSVRDFLARQDLDTWVTRPRRECLSPKGRYAYRVSTQLDPLDSLLYLALVYEIGGMIETARVPAEESVVFSHRFGPSASGQMYRHDIGWLSFTSACVKRAMASTISWVVLADISDFFQRVYHHRIQNTLDAVTCGSPHARVLTKFISQWRGGPSFGIPIGPSPSRLLAEITIDDVDHLLLASQSDFCRYSDDYRIFCRSRKEAYEKLASLAEALHQNHGLALQPQKTRIMSSEDFVKFAARTPESKELNNLAARFEVLVTALDLDSPYEAIDYEDLDHDHRQLVDALNLEDLLDVELGKEEPDVALTRFILRRLAQLNHSDPALKLITNAEKCYEVFSVLMEYLSQLTGLQKTVRDRVGAEVIKLITSSIVGHLPYHRCWLLSLFAAKNGWGQDTELNATYHAHSDPFTRRKAILGMGRARMGYWFRARLNDAMSLEAWQRRAFLAAVSCLPKDEQDHWYRAQRTRLDPLDDVVVRWARANPF